MKEDSKMTKILKLAPAALLAIIFAAGMLAPASTISAGEEANLDKMIPSAKTAADHEAIAKEYERQAAAAKAEATMHVEMGAAYKKVGGSLIEKLHFDTHCDNLANLYKKIAKEDEALAAAHEEMAKGAK
jgi:hypothetical protein